MVGNFSDSSEMLFAVAMMRARLLRFWFHVRNEPTILVTTPPYAVPTGRENALHALAVDRAANLPVMLYNYPGRMAAHTPSPSTTPTTRPTCWSGCAASTSR